MSRKIHKSRLKSYFFENYGYFNSKKGLVRTPTELATQMTDKLPNSLFTSNSKTFLDPHCDASWTYLNVVKDRLLEEGHSLENVQSRIWGFCSTEAAVQLVKFYTGLIHIYCVDFLDTEAVRDKIGEMKFDCVVGNPPYQKKVGPKNTEPIWHLFVEQSIRLLETDGWLCFVHPSGWRNVDGRFKNVGNLIMSLDVRYLEIHNKADGNRTFGASTPYDWYVLQNRKSAGKTEVKFQDGVVKTLDLTKLPFIPNGSFDSVMRLMAKGDERRCETIGDYVYAHRSEHVSRKKTGKFCHPIIYTVKSGDIANCWYSSEKLEHFGVPKVVWSNGGITMGVFIDAAGEYGLMEYAYAIVDEPKNLPKIKSAITSDAFKKLIIESTDDGSINRRVLALFRKDFWKDFV